MKLKIQWGFILYIALIGLIDGIKVSISLLFTLMIHESAHLIVGMLCKEQYESISLTPLGGMISYRSGSISHKGAKGMAIAAAGPAANIAALILVDHSAAINKILMMLDLKEKFTIMNFSMAAINLIPVLPLDGGRIVFCLGYYLFPISVLSAVLAALGRLCGGVCIGLSLFSVSQWGKLNVSLLAAGMYIIVCAGRYRNMVCAVNLHTVIQERLDQTDRMTVCRIISVNGNMRLSCVLPHLIKSQRLICYVNREKDFIPVDENQLLNMLLISPCITFAEAFPEILKT